MKKKDSLTQKNKEDWSNFLKDTSRVPDKDQTLHTDSVGKRFRFDLHGLGLDEALKAELDREYPEIKDTNERLSEFK